MKLDRKKCLSVVLVAALLLTLFVSVYLITEHADHDCTGEDCEICVILDHALHLLQQLTLTALTLLAAVLLPALLGLFCGARLSLRCLPTLTTLKVKLNN